MISGHAREQGVWAGARRCVLLLVMVWGLACAPTAPSSSGSKSAGSTPAGSSSQPTAAQAAAPPFRMRIAYAEPTPALSALWVANEAGFFARHGLDVDMSYVQSAQTVPAVIGG